MHQEQEYNIIDSKDDFNGWSILNVEDWKPGVKRVTIRKMGNAGTTILIVFSKDEYLEDLFFKGKK